jgi:hypothetical protein
MQVEQSRLSTEIQRLSDQAGLGPWQRTLRNERLPLTTIAIALLPIYCVVVVAIAGLLAYGALIAQRVSMAGVVVVTAFAALSAVLIRFTVRSLKEHRIRRTAEYHVFAGGAIVVRGGRPLVFSWADVRKVHQAQLQAMLGGAAVAAAQEAARKWWRLDVELTDGRGVTIKDRTRALLDLAESIQLGVARTHLTAAVQQIGLGEQLDFEAIRVDAAGIHVTNRRRTQSLPWERVLGVAMPGPHVLIRTAGSRREWLTAPSNEVVNFGLFAAVVQRLAPASTS